MNLIFLGAPGAGKGTQAEFISDYLNIPTISTGNIIREALKSGTEVGLKAKSYIDKGLLVPDEVVINIIKSRLVKSDCSKGFILDGFPRTVPQAEALKEMEILIDKVIDIDVEDIEVEKRLSGRRVCSSCGSSYHIVYKPSKIEGCCDRCNGEIIQRKDDKPETIKERLKVYHSQTAPLKDYYKNQNKLFIISGKGKVDEITKLTIEAIERKV